MSTQHTPTPYSVGTDTARDAAPGRVHILAQSDVGTLETVAVASTPANAAFIVRVCNSHDALVAALRALTHQIDIGTFIDSHGHSAKMLKAQKDAHAALAAVEGNSDG